jgi:hypothetical protein
MPEKAGPVSSLQDLFLESPPCPQIVLILADDLDWADTTLLTATPGQAPPDTKAFRDSLLSCAHSRRGDLRIALPMK